MPNLSEVDSVAILKHFNRLDVRQLDHLFGTGPRDFAVALVSEVLRLRQRLEWVEGRVESWPSDG